MAINAEQRSLDAYEEADPVLAAVFADSIAPHVELFFDTEQLYNMTVGMYGFGYTDADGGLRFDVKRFADEKSLVESMAGAGLLGQIHLLAPHQTEFALHVKDRFRSRGFEVYPPQAYAESFLNALSSDNSLDLEIHFTEEVVGNELVLVPDRRGGAVLNVFKATQNLLGFWPHRLQEFIQSGKVILDPTDVVSGAQIIGDSDFPKLYREFQTRRGDKEEQNRKDSVAIMLLIKRLDLFKRGSRKYLPMMYLSESSMRLWENVLISAELYHRLTYFLDGVALSVLKPSAYMVRRAAFVGPGGTLSEGLATVDESLRNASAVEMYLRRVYGVDGLDGGSGYGRLKKDDVQRLLSRAVDAELLERVTPFIERAHLVEIGSKLAVAEVAALALLAAQDNATKDKIDHFARSTERELGEAGRETSRALLIWEGIDHLVGELRGSFGARSFDRESIWLNLRVIHLCLPEDAKESVLNAVEAIVQGDEDKLRVVKHEVLSICYHARNVDHVDLDHSGRSLASAMTLMYLARHPQALAEVVELGRERADIEEPWKLLLMSVALYRLHRVDEADGIVSRLDRLYDEQKVGRGQLATGLAVVHFRKLMSYRFRKTRMSRSEEDQELERCIVMASSAYNLLPDGVLKVYALNQILFFLVRRRAVDIRTLNKYALELKSFKDSRDWSHLYDDTLARFYLRLAQGESDQETGTVLLATARTHIEDALKDGPRNREVEDMAAEIAIEAARLHQELNVART